MKLSWKTYLVLALVFAGSLLWAITLPTEAITRQVLALPGVASLIGALYQLLRDEAQHQRNILIQKARQEFDLADNRQDIVHRFFRHDIVHKSSLTIE